MSSPETRIQATDIDKVWGPAKAVGAGALGLSARLSSAKARRGVVERVRPKCDATHAVSVWVKGSTHSELHLDGRRRFAGLRDRNTFQLARAGESVRAVLSQSHGECIDLYLPHALLKDFAETELGVSGDAVELVPARLEGDPEIVNLARRLAEEIERPAIATGLAIDGATLLLAAALIRRWSNRSNAPAWRKGGLAPWQVRRALELMRAPSRPTLSLQELSAEVGLSPYHFARSFKISVGEPPHKHHVRLRLERARDLVESTDLAISEIAADAGYDDVSYFAKAFRTAFHANPSAHRALRRS